MREPSINKDIFMKSQITTEEQTALQSSGLCQKTPYAIQGVSSGQLSVCQHFGGCRVQGVMYSYLPETDELVRVDVVRWLKNYRKDADKKAVAEGLEKQGRLF